MLNRFEKINSQSLIRSLMREELCSITGERIDERLLDAYFSLGCIASAQLQYIFKQDPVHIYTDVLSELMDLTGASYGFVGHLLHPPQSTSLDFSVLSFISDASTNITPPHKILIENFESHPLGFYKDLSEGILKEGGSELFQFLPDTPEIKSFILLPLVFGQNVFGLIGLFNPTRYQNDHEITLLTPFLRTVANLMQREKIKQEKAHAEEQLLEREKLFKKFVGSAPAAVAMLNCDLNFLLVSKKWVSDFGIGAKQIIGKHIFLVIPELQEMFSPVFKSALTGQKYRSILKDVPLGVRGIMNIKMHVEPWYTGAGKRGGIFVFAEDMTEEVKIRRKHEKLIHELKETNQALQRFTQFCSHDFKEPLRTISSFAQILQNDELTASKQREYLSVIVQAAHRMNALIHDLLNISKVDEIQFRKDSIDVRSLIQEIEEDLLQLITEKNAIIRVRNAPLFYGDKKLCKQVFQNLITNSIKFNNTPSPTIEIEGIEESAFVSIRVKDNGIGIPLEYKERIFDALERLHGKKYEGSGIGLALCQKLMQLHNGSIELESSSDQGSIFLLRFPNQSPSGEGAPTSCPLQQKKPIES